jgi:hypothetical protein
MGGAAPLLDQVQKSAGADFFTSRFIGNKVVNDIKIGRCQFWTKAAVPGLKILSSSKIARRMG